MIPAMDRNALHPQAFSHGDHASSCSATGSTSIRELPAWQTHPYMRPRHACEDQ